MPCASACSPSSIAFAERLRTDDAAARAARPDAADVAVFVVERYGGELTAVITHTIERWDGKEAARRIELHVGRDLQFIRINGTIVGGLVGVLIHAVSAAGSTESAVKHALSPLRRYRESRRTTSIRLGQFLKLANLIESGSDAKPLVADGQVQVNGEVETPTRPPARRTGDVVTLARQSARVATGEVEIDVPWC